MSRRKASSIDQSEMYMLSLDTFMLMAVMGITVGILFIVVNPALSIIERMVMDKIPSLEDISLRKFNQISSGLAEYSNIDDIDDLIFSMNIGDEIEYLDRTSSQIKIELIKRLEKGFWKISVYFRIVDDIVTPEVLITDIRRTIVWGKEEEKKEILQELRKWDRMRTLALGEQND